MSWKHCMEDKIKKHYGDEVKDCIKGITKDNWKDIARCIATIKGITTDIEVWVAEQAAFFTAWSLECAIPDAD